jgi:hypothetical protein
MILRRLIIETDLICALARTLAEEWARSYSVKRILNLKRERPDHPRGD